MCGCFIRHISNSLCVFAYKLAPTFFWLIWFLSLDSKKTDGQRDKQTERQIDKLGWFACYLRRNQMGVKSASVSCSRFFVASYLNPSSYFPFKRHYLKCCEDKYDVKLNNVHFVADSLKVILMKLLTKTIFSFN